jgi:hypothetical protein
MTPSFTVKRATGPPLQFSGMNTASLQYLLEIQCNGDMIIQGAIGQGWTLPPRVSSIDGICDWVTASFILASSITDVTVRVSVGKNLDMVHELTKHLTLLLSTCSIDGNGGPCSQIQDVR